MTPSSFEDDLAFMKGLADGEAGRGQQALFGKLYFAAGLIYGLQVVVQWADMTGAIDLPFANPLVALPTNVVFLSYLGWEIWKNRRLGGGTMTSRGINAAFAAVGAANIAVLIILLIGAWRLQEPLVGVLIPCVIFALQGAAWFVAYLLRKRLWLLGVAAGWMGTAIAMAWYVGTMTVVALIGVGILLWMAIPGFVMMRLARRAA